jgi:hypothetical protein
LKNPQIYEVIPTWLFVDINSLQKLIEVIRRTMLENLVPLNVYLQINLKGKKNYLG